MDRDRLFWGIIREALLAVVNAIELYQLGHKTTTAMIRRQWKESRKAS